jgi:UDP-GlcNAc:undecaprenyl-phosphate/decaprenyl-phosphate GlcNAc-1-phosphate transferase
VKSAFLALVFSLVVVASLTPLVRALAFRLGAVARPGSRHVHQKSIPLLGGLAICAGFLAAIAALYLLDPRAEASFRYVKLRMIGLSAGGAAMCLVGALGDTRGVRALHKLAAQVVASVGAYACGFRILAVHVPFLGDFDTTATALPLTVLWIVGIVNVINLIDGLDGLAAGIVFFAATTNLVVSWLYSAPLVLMLSGAIAGSVLGFLFYNWNPARIFMGNSGSYFLGYVLATTALISAEQKASTAVSLLVPVLALGVPIFDALFTMARRVAERRSLFSAERGHIQHRLLEMGLTQRRAVVILYAVSGAFTAIAIGVSLEHTWQVGVALLAAAALMVGLTRFVGYFEDLHLRLRQKARFRSREAERIRYAIPPLPPRFRAARTEAELLQELWRFATAAGLGFVEVQGGEAALRWPEGIDTEGAAFRDMLAASYPIGDAAATATVRFGWRGDSDDVSPDVEILLQVVTDVLAENLSRVGSGLAPRQAPEREPLQVL